MDGLECTEISLSNLERTRRIDSEFYKKECLIIAQILKDINAVPITNYLNDVSDGNHMTISDRFQPKGIPYYRGQDIHNFFIESAAPICIDEEAYNNPYMHRSHIKKGDVLLSIVGTIGESALVFSDRKATCSCKLAILRPTSTIFSPLLAIYLKTKYGFNQIEKFKRGAVQMGYLLEDMDQLLIPFFSNSFIKYIAEIVNRAHDIMKESEITYKNAEGILSKEIGFTPSIYFSGQTAIKKRSESFALTGRLDAEYYQPKYEDITRLLNTANTVDSLCNIYDKSFTPLNNSYYQYIELADVGLNGVIDGVETICGLDLPTRARRIVKTGQVIISSIEGSLQSCALIPEKYNNALCSTGFYVIDSDVMNSETLLLLFKSEPIQLLMKQRCSGTILTGISKNEFLSMPLPLIDDDVQKYIAAEVQKSFSIRKQSQHLIDNAIHAVEVAIENGEEVALKWLKENVESLEG